MALHFSAASQLRHDVTGRIPSATYRLQFRAGVGFRTALGLVPYLKELGISHIYASPLFKARPGSEHGYDIVDPTVLDPELGTTAEFHQLVRALHDEDMGLILDIVPNHMAADASNPWWMDVLEFGSASPYWDFFDINWLRRHADSDSGSQGDSRVASDLGPAGDAGPTFLLPALAGPLADCLRDGSLRVALHEVDLGPGRGLTFFLEHYDQRFPLNAGSWRGLLGLEMDSVGGAGAGKSGGGAARPEPGEPPRRLLELLEEIGVPQTGRCTIADRGIVHQVKKQLAVLHETDGDVRGFLESRIAAIAAAGGCVRARLLLDAMRTVPYRLVDARCATSTFAYRRFFDVNGLVGVRVEDEKVFTETHKLALDLVATGKIDGLRLDHVDGLRDPEGYLSRLRRGLGEVQAPNLYVIVEKILGSGETLRPSWPVDGTTGYGFMSAVGQIFVDRQGLDLLEDVHARLVGGRVDFAGLAYTGKKTVLRRLFGGEFQHLADRLAWLVDCAERRPSLSSGQLREALAEITCSLPVYRTYLRDLNPEQADLDLIRRAVEAVEARGPARAGSGAAYVGQILSLDPSSPPVMAHPREALELVLRWQQLTGPLAAKGVEDTALYRDTRLLSLDEVGGEPTVPGGAIGRLHCRNRQVLANWPGDLNATSTHDAKRSEDVRARFDVLAEIPGEWSRRLGEWMGWNAGKRGRRGEDWVPDGREEILIYQTLVGAWPAGGLGREAAARAEFTARMKGFVVKALREAKVHSDWRRPDETYEGLVTGFVDGIMGDTSTPFLAGVEELARAVGWFGAINSLAQLLTKIISPGVADFYQGNELWEFALTDPDNRRPVDFGLRERLLEEVRPLDGSGPRGANAGNVGHLLARWHDGRIKLLVTRRALALRRAETELFERGSYADLSPEGPLSDRLLIILRHMGDSWALAVIPRLPVALLGPSARTYSAKGLWGGARLALPQDTPDRWTDALRGRVVVAGGGVAGYAGSHELGSSNSLLLAHVLEELPMALLFGRRPT